ncbi:MAG: metal-dependent hydrolase [Saprospiraceae bacterium]|nr:metal-dependent hydrolase [Saprospiraceae bacterium]
MDSITQVVLGAACGELVAGKKMGNRAMIWGGIGGTISDLDVLANVFMDPVNAMMFHRGPMHSLMFASLIPLLLGPLVKKLYDRDWYQRKFWQWIGFGLGIILYSFSAFVIFFLSKLVAGDTPWIITLFLLLTGVAFFYARFQKIKNHPSDISNVPVKIWIQLFFWSIFTHPLLDSLTTYGTQLFWPFSDYRVSISSISIVDPLYTIPFALSLLAVALCVRGHQWRRYFIITGVCISSAYMLFTFWNKLHINEKFKNSLVAEHVHFKNYMTVPTILNNALWYGIAETDTGYVCGYYSLFDDKIDFRPLQFIQHNHQILDPYRNQYLIEKLPWFSDGYYKVISSGLGEYDYYDLRFGSMRGNIHDHESIIFKMKLLDRDGQIELIDEARPENKKEDIEWFKQRIFGKIQ